MSNNYTKGLKSTALFGGVKIFSIIILIIRGKFVAVLLGPGGMGISGLLLQTIDTIKSFTDLGICVSAVRNIAASSATKNEEEISKTVNIVRKLVWVTGLLGALVTCFLSPWLSKLAFGNTDYAIAFIWLSVTLIIDHISAGQHLVMQGLMKYNYLAKSNVIGQAIGLCITVPLYYIWNVDAIVPGLIISSIISLCLSRFFSKKIPIKQIKVDKTTFLKKSNGILKQGIAIRMSTIITLLSSYILRMYISKLGGIEGVGMYNAGFIIGETYVSLVFAAMATDYFPRLSTLAGNKKETQQLVSDQTMMGMLILFPIIIAFMLLTPLIVKILLSSDFLIIVFFLQTMMFGMIFKMCVWSLRFVFIANKDNKMLVLSDIFLGVLAISLNILFYKYFGINGLGVSYTLIYLLNLVLFYYLVYYKHKFMLNAEVIKFFLLFMTILSICYYSVVFIDNTTYSVIILSVFLLFSIIFSLYHLEKRSGLIKIFKNKFFKNK